MNAKQSTIFFDLETGEITSEQTSISVLTEAKETQQIENRCVCLYPDFRIQRFEGYGCALTDSACYLLSRMSDDDRENALNCWFGSGGMDARFVRVPMDSCDYSLDEYQAVVDPIADPTLSTFTTERADRYIIPVLKEVVRLSDGKISVLLSSWSPPAQWKTPPEITQNDAATYGAMGQNVDIKKPGRCFGGRLRKEYYPHWASYLVKYMQNYLDVGIPVTMLTVQNESAAATNWDSCIWSAEDQAEFVRDHLYQQMERAGLTDKVGLYIWDHNKERLIENVEAMMDAGIGNLIQGFAFHWYSGDHFEALSLLHHKYPDKVLLHSESCGLHIPGKAFSFDIPAEAIPLLPEDMRADAGRTPSEVDLADAVSYAHDIIGDLNHGLNRWIDWNLVVDRRGGPRHVPGGFAAPLVCENDGTLTKTLSYEWLRLIARTIHAEACVLGVSSFGTEVEAAAAQNPDGTIGVLLLNRSKEKCATHIRISGSRIDIELKPNALSAVLLSE